MTHSPDARVVQPSTTSNDINISILVGDLADMMDDCADEDGQWDGGDVCEALSDRIARLGGWKRCDNHGVYSARKPSCPLCLEVRP